METSPYVNTRRSIAYKTGILCLLFFSIIYIYSHDYFKKDDPPTVAKVSINGAIEVDLLRDKLIRDIATNDKYSALLLYIDSGGGNAFGSEATYQAVRSVSAVKPVVVVMGGYAASGGYWISLAADHVVAHKVTYTGSVGVRYVIQNYKELLDKIGIKAQVYRSGVLKAPILPVEEINEISESEARRIIDEWFNIFLQDVKERRELSDDVISQIKTGKLYIASEALSLGLIDDIGTEETALKWLKNERNIDDLTVTELQYEDSSIILFRNLISGLQSCENLLYNLLSVIKGGVR